MGSSPSQLALDGQGAVEQRAGPERRAQTDGGVEIVRLGWSTRRRRLVHTASGDDEIEGIGGGPQVLQPIAEIGAETQDEKGGGCVRGHDVVPGARWAPNYRP